MLSTVFSVMFTIFNTILMSFLFEDKRMRNWLIITTYVAQTVILYTTNFIWDGLSYHTITALIIAILFTIILIPAFGYLTDAIMQEAINEMKINYQQKDNFRKMFDSLQEGIILIQAGKITFMNDLSNKLLSTVCKLNNFFLNINDTGETDEQDPLDRKIFYIFENTKSSISNKSRKKKSHGSDYSKTHSSDNSIGKKVEYSLRDLSQLQF